MVAFDGGSLHVGLQRAGYSSSTVLYLALTVPLLIGAINHALGLLAGAIGGALGRWRLKVAVGVFIAGFGALTTALVMLMVFRSEAAAGQNGTLLRCGTAAAAAPSNIQADRHLPQGSFSSGMPPARSTPSRPTSRKS